MAAVSLIQPSGSLPSILPLTVSAAADAGCLPALRQACPHHILILVLLLHVLAGMPLLKALALVRWGFPNAKGKARINAWFSLFMCFQR